MKLRNVAPTAALALAALTLVAGCNKGASNANGTNTTTTTNNTTTSASPTTPGATPAASATPVMKTGGSTPTEAFRAYYEAIKRGDSATVRSLFSRATMKMLEDDAKRRNKTVDEVFDEGFKSAADDVPATMPEVRNEKIDGDRATLEINDAKKGKWEPLKFVKEDGQWKLAFADDGGDDDGSGEDNN